MSTYRRLLPNEPVFPKLHYLEDHMVHFIRKWRLGPGILGEQGEESIHSLFNRLQLHFSGMPVATDLFRQIMKHHLLQANPGTKPPPEPQRRKK